MGAFRAAADPRFEIEAQRELGSIAEHIRERTRAWPGVSLILTGSFARGEGTIVEGTGVAEAGGCSRWLSDVECLLAYDPEVVRADGGLDMALRAIEAVLNQDAGNRARGISVEVRSIPAPWFRTLRPAIFTRELCEHGKLLWGNPVHLSAPRCWRPGLPIPLGDAFRLLNNRIMEQVETRLVAEESPLGTTPSSYALVKFWIDIATSLSVFLDCYETSYRARHRNIREILDARPGLFGADDSRLLVARLDEAMAFKLGACAANHRIASGEINRAAAMAARIWNWESARMLSAPPQRMEWKSVVSRLARLETPLQRMRDWMRLALRSRMWLHSGAGVVRGALRAGSFANAIYGAGCVLDFFWDEVGSDSEEGRRISQTLAGLLNVNLEQRGPRRRTILATTALEAWRQHLRFAAV